jgi:hypothetical protein
LRKKRVYRERETSFPTSLEIRQSLKEMLGDLITPEKAYSYPVTTSTVS